MVASNQGPEKLNIERVKFIINTVSISFGIVAVGCFTAGVLTLVFVSPTSYFPYSTGSGIWTGLVTVLISISGWKFTTNYKVENPTASRCTLLTFFSLITTDIICASMHLTYSSIGLHYCISSTPRYSGDLFCDDVSSRIAIVCGFNAVFGMFLVVVSLTTLLYLICGGKVQLLTGRPTNNGEWVTCCGGYCTCYVSNEPSVTYFNGN